jgi:hypothetical protein
MNLKIIGNQSSFNYEFGKNKMFKRVSSLKYSKRKYQSVASRLPMPGRIIPLI